MHNVTTMTEILMRGYRDMMNKTVTIDIGIKMCILLFNLILVVSLSLVILGSNIGEPPISIYKQHIASTTSTEQLQTLVVEQ
jgi:hypothetical protein